MIDSIPPCPATCYGKPVRSCTVRGWGLGWGVTGRVMSLLVIVVCSKDECSWFASWAPKAYSSRGRRSPGTCQGGAGGRQVLYKVKYHC